MRYVIKNKRIKEIKSEAKRLLKKPEAKTIDWFYRQFLLDIMIASPRDYLFVEGLRLTQRKPMGVMYPHIVEDMWKWDVLYWMDEPTEKIRAFLEIPNYDNLYDD